MVGGGGKFFSLGALVYKQYWLDLVCVLCGCVLLSACGDCLDRYRAARRFCRHPFLECRRLFFFFFLSFFPFLFPPSSCLFPEFEHRRVDFLPTSYYASVSFGLLHAWRSATGVMSEEKKEVRGCSPVFLLLSAAAFVGQGRAGWSHAAKSTLARPERAVSRRKSADRQIMQRLLTFFLHLDFWCIRLPRHIHGVGGGGGGGGGGSPRGTVRPQVLGAGSPFWLSRG
ncbi:hypothetical protein IWX90DRAFT_249841 [Phyllosticta citrichinensis]|uniref:Uncharacterized protein n=1 Tax=Phyllosticta citrichinensis TaxID=1130410 RepID=A0ABR1XQZ8_9PEZI